MKTKTILAVLSIIAFGSNNSAFSQKTTNTKDKDIFSPYWFMQGQVGGAYTVGEATFSKLISPTAALSFGRQFTPIWGARLQVNGWEAKGAWISPYEKYKFNYIGVNADVLINLMNLFSSYKAKRVFDLYLLGGVGFNHGFNNGVNDLPNASDFTYNWEKFNRITGRFGVQGDFRLSSRWSLNLEVNANILSDRFNSKDGGNNDWYCNALAGVTYKFDRKTVAPIVVAPTVIEENNQKTNEQRVEQKVPETINEPQANTEKQNTKPQKEEQTTTYSSEIFYSINQMMVPTGERQKIDQLLEWAKNHPDARIIVTGYADAGTGTAQINLRTSRNRAQNLTQLLIRSGIDKDRIITEAKGDTVQPFKENDMNRVVIICTDKEK